MIWQFAFLVGLVTSPSVANYIFGNYIKLGNSTITMFDSNYSSLYNPLAWVIGGFLVGYGTRMGNGCTSGHGVCGLPRFSKRSFAAVLTFLACGIGMATFRNYFEFLNGSDSTWLSGDTQ